MVSAFMATQKLPHAAILIMDLMHGRNSHNENCRSSKYFRVKRAKMW